MTSFIDLLVININNYLKTLNPKPKFEQGQIGISEGFYLINSDTDDYNQEQYITTCAISLKHKIVNQGRGIMEAEIRLKELSKFLNNNYLISNEKFRNIGIVDTNFIVYNYLFTIISNK